MPRKNSRLQQHHLKLIHREYARQADGTYAKRFYYASADTCTEKTAKYPDGILSDNPFHPRHEVWFAKHLESLADTTDLSPEDLIREFTAGDVLDRAQAWQSVGNYFGFEELDQYPVDLSRQETADRIKPWMKELKDKNCYD